MSHLKTTVATWTYKVKITYDDTIPQRYLEYLFDYEDDIVDLAVATFQSDFMFTNRKRQVMETDYEIGVIRRDIPAGNGLIEQRIEVTLGRDYADADDNVTLLAESRVFIQRTGMRF